MRLPTSVPSCQASQWRGTVPSSLLYTQTASQKNKTVMQLLVCMQFPPPFQTDTKKNNKKSLKHYDVSSHTSWN